MDDTRAQILAILQRLKQARARELAQELGVTEATVRRHLDKLLREQRVARTIERGGPGRPNHLFSALGEAPAPSPAGLQRLAGGLLFEAEGLDSNLAALLVDRLAHRMALRHGARLADKRGEECLDEALAVLRDEGYEVELERGEDADNITLGRCPFGDLAKHNPALCNLESRLLERLLGAEVERRSTIAQGAPRCLLAVRAARPLAPPATAPAAPERAIPLAPG